MTRVEDRSTGASPRGVWRTFWGMSGSPSRSPRQQYSTARERGTPHFLASTSGRSSGCNPSYNHSKGLVPKLCFPFTTCYAHTCMMSHSPDLLVALLAIAVCAFVFSACSRSIVHACVSHASGCPKAAYPHTGYTKQPQRLLVKIVPELQQRNVVQRCMSTSRLAAKLITQQLVQGPSH